MNAIAPLLVLLASFMLIALSVVPASGPFDLGGGEKDVLRDIPLLLWSTVYFSCILVLWVLRRTVLQSFSVASAIAPSGIAVIWRRLAMATYAAAR